MLIAGATGPNAASVNGIFDPTAEMINGACVFKKRGEDFILQYGTNKKWTVTLLGDKGKDSGWATLAAADPSKPPEQATATWRVAINNAWDDQASVKISRAP